jgi:hypothetical protein
MGEGFSGKIGKADFTGSGASLTSYNRSSNVNRQASSAIPRHYIVI